MEQKDRYRSCVTALMTPETTVQALLSFSQKLEVSR
jgi:hypothetical protein